MEKFACMYLRLSREDGDSTESNSISNQRQIIKSYARDNDFKVVAEYVDDGFSGSNFDRPKFKKMILDLEEKKFKTIIVKDLSRFGRDYIESGKYLQKIFPEKGIRFISVNDNYDSENADVSDTHLILPIRNFINDSYCRDISMKVKSSKEVKRCQFSFTGIDEWIGETKVEYEKIDSKYKYEVNIDNINESIYLVKDENLKFTSEIEIKIGSSGFNEEFYWGLESIDGQDLSIKSTMNNLKIVKELLEILITVPIDFSYLKFKVPIEEMDNKLVIGYLVSSGINTGKYRRINTDIPYAKIKENFENILCNWYEKRHKLTLISQNFIINKYARQYNQSVLLNSIKNLEIYHRNFIREKETNKNKNLEIDKSR